MHSIQTTCSIFKRTPNKVHCVFLQVVFKTMWTSVIERNVKRDTVIVKRRKVKRKEVSQVEWSFTYTFGLQNQEIRNY